MDEYKINIYSQVTYLIDKAFNVGKGANSIISILHDFFEAHGMGIPEI